MLDHRQAADAGADSHADARGVGGLGVLSHTINAERIVFCRRLAQRNESQEAFTYGWFRRVVELLSHVLHKTPVPSEWLDEVKAVQRGEA
ncbi:hypothetical protein [Sphingomonas trueperi]|uniref:hypothetical protein n=1 Tax=Sphingomonas trueperi TaxID=53317 RepID=UPI0031E0A8C9